MEATPTPIPMADAPARAASARSMGATLGAVLGLAAMAGLYELSAVPEVEAVLHVRLILGPGGYDEVPFSAVLAWTVAPVAAAIAGWFNAARALGGRRWAGVWMGYATYGVAIVIAPFVIYALPSLTMFAPSDLASMAKSTADLAAGSVMLVILSGIILAPLLLVCASLGALWARVLRAVLGATPTSGEDSPPAASGPVLLAIAIVLGILWSGIAVTLIGSGGLFGGGEFID